MTSRTYKTSSAAVKVEAVVVTGGWGDFLINREEISSSIYYHASDFSRLGNHMFQVFHYNGEDILLLDFDRYLNKYFSITPSGKSCIIFFFDIRPGSPLKEQAELFMKTACGETPLSNTAAVKITGTAALHHIPLKEFHFFPEPVRTPLVKQGILCLRITETAGIQYLIDLHTLMATQLERISTGYGNE